jgi:hypothetical protein
MRITKNQLQKLIDEEYSRAVARRARGLREAPGDQDQDEEEGYDDFGSESFEDEMGRHQKKDEATAVEADGQDKQDQLPPELDERRRGGGGALFEIEAYELLEFAKAYAAMGNAVQEQLDTILDGNERDFPSMTNSNAIKMIEDDLGGMNEEIDDAIQAYNDWWESKGKMGDDEDEDEEDDGTWAAAARANGMKVR